MSDKTIDQEIIRQTARTLAKELATGNHTTKKIRQESSANAEEVKRTIERATTVTCEMCDSHTFKQSYVIKRLSAIMSPTGEEAVIPVQVFQCGSCDHINSDFLPNSAIADVASRVAMRNVKKQTQS